MMAMTIGVEFSREVDGRWIAEVDRLGVLVYGQTRADAYRRAKAAALFALSSAVEAGAKVSSLKFEAL